LVIMLKLITSQLFVMAVLGTEPEVCAVTNAGSFGGWDDVSCDSVNTYICEIPASKNFFVITYIWYVEAQFKIYYLTFNIFNTLFCEHHYLYRMLLYRMQGILTSAFR
jgi:hypothetical protein